jgi:hypothetical protein
MPVNPGAKLGSVSSPPTLNKQALALVQEFQRHVSSLSEADAYKLTFMIFALCRGWRKAKISRYLGISRARVGQKIAKCQQYAESGNMPVLERLLAQVPEKKDNNSDVLAQFHPAQWEDPSFAQSMLDLVA